MAKNKLNKFVGAVVVGTVIMAVPACTDTWDDHYNGGDYQDQATETLWELISSKPELSRFAEIAKNAKYWKDEKHEIKDYTYADVLNSGQINTVWAPTNDCFTEDEYQNWLNLCQTEGYTVQEQFMANHISMFRHIANDNKVDTIKMINGKNMEFDKSGNTMTFQGKELQDVNIPAVNGMLHTINGVAPFHYNFYEQIKFGSRTPKLSEFFISRDTTYFSEDSSIEGLPDENGNPTYVDSVYFTSNRLFSYSYLPVNNSDEWDIAEMGVNARLTVEDSTFIMLMLTDAAWDEAVERLKPLYKYAAKYEDKYKGNSNVTNAYRPIADPDSLTKMSVEQDIVAPTVFNINKQPKIGGEGGELWTIEKFMETKGEAAEYFLNTRYDTLRTTDNWNKTSLLNGTPLEASNGFAYELDKWDFPLQYYKPDVEVNINGGVFYNTSSTNYYKTNSYTTKSYGFNSETYKEITDRYGKVYNNDFYFIDDYNGGNPKVEIRLVGNCNDAYVPGAQVMSGKYDVQVVMVPSWYRTIANAGVADTMYLDQHYVDSISDKSKNIFKVQLRYCNGTSNGKDATTRATTITWDNSNKVDTLTVIEGFEFPYSYKNMRYTYPTLIIEGANTKSNANKGYIYSLCIDQVILRSKEDGSQIVIEQGK